MKRSSLILAGIALVTAVTAVSVFSTAARAADPAKLPVYIYITSSMGDFVNHDMTSERLRRTLPMLETYRKQNSSLVANLNFSGAASDDLERHNQDDHLVDLIKGYQKSGLVEVGYDGNNEVSSAKHPLLHTEKSLVPEERWDMRNASAQEVLNAEWNPLTGDPVPGKIGGLPKMQQVFGPAAAVRGVVLVIPNPWGPMVDVGIDSEIAMLVRKANPTAMMVGVADSDAAHTGSAYRAWTEQFTAQIARSARAYPELYWQDGILRSSESSTREVRLARAMDGADKTKELFEKLDRQRVRIIHVEVGSDRIYPKGRVVPDPAPPAALPYAWTHTGNPQYPAEMRRSAAQIDASYAAQEAAIKYLVNEFIPANPGSRFVSSNDLKQLTTPGWGYDIPMTELRAAVSEQLKTWGESTEPPQYLELKTHFLSEADMFQVMADALAAQSRTGKLPDKVSVARVYGPMNTRDPEKPVTGDVTAADVAKACEPLVAALHDDTWVSPPHNMLPSTIPVAGKTVVTPQFLRLMEEALVAQSGSDTLKIRPIRYFWGREETFYRRRLGIEAGSYWTVKPAFVSLFAQQE
jgi:hypothetical protein